MATIEGSAGADALTGTSDFDVISGGPGADTIYGGGGHDRLDGGPGDDAVFGGVDGSYLGDVQADGGNDALYGGAGDDYFELFRLQGQAASSSAITGGGGADQLHFIGYVDQDESYVFFGGAGNDVVNSVGGRQVSIDLGDGDDSASMLEADRVAIDGGAGDDRLSIDALNHSVDGSQWRLTLGPGTDTVSLFSVAEVSPYGDSINAAFAQVVVTDFQIGVGGDRLEIDDLMRAVGRGWDGGDPFVEGYLKLIQVGDDAVLVMDKDAHGARFEPHDLVTFDGAQAGAFLPQNLGGYNFPASTLADVGVDAPASVREGVDGSFHISLTFQNVGALSATATMSYSATSTATNGVDVDVLPTTQAIDIVQTPAGDYTVDLSAITVIDDGAREPTETIAVTISIPGHTFANGASTTTVSVALLDADDRIAGSESADRLAGTTGDDHILAGGGDDTIAAGRGADILDGDTGIDTLAYSGFAHDYALALNGGAGAVSGVPEAGRDTLTSVEIVQFLDGTLTFDTASTAAQIVRLYDSFLGRAPDVAGFNSYLNYFAAGHSFQDMAAAAAASPEFATASAGLSDADYITYVYKHSLHRAPDAYGMQQYLDALHSGALTRTSMIVQAAESPEHVALTAGLVAAGLWVPDAHVEGLELLYDAAVRRQPDAYGLSEYGKALTAGTTFKQIANQMASSPEFQAAHAGQSDAQYVDNLYVAEVGRHADPYGLSVYTAELAHGATRGDILYETAMSAEHQSHVLSFYDPLLIGA